MTKPILFQKICTSWNQMLRIIKKAIISIKKYFPIQSMISNCPEARNWIKWFGIANYKLFLLCSKSNNSSLTFSRAIHNPYVPKKELLSSWNELSYDKITTKTWLPKVAAIFTHKLAFFIKLVLQHHFIQK